MNILHIRRAVGFYWRPRRPEGKCGVEIAKAICSANWACACDCRARVRTSPLGNAVQKLKVADGISKRPQSYRSHRVGWEWEVLCSKKGNGREAYCLCFLRPGLGSRSFGRILCLHFCLWLPLFCVAQRGSV